MCKKKTDTTSCGYQTRIDLDTDREHCGDCQVMVRKRYATTEENGPIRVTPTANSPDTCLP